LGGIKTPSGWFRRTGSSSRKRQQQQEAAAAHRPLPELAALTAHSTRMQRLGLRLLVIPHTNCHVINIAEEQQVVNELRAEVCENLRLKS
jgi:hypothetical protein